MKMIGLTGGIGSGKSEAARRFAHWDIPIIDADMIGHTLIAPDGEAVQSVVETFGYDILNCGTIDRKALGAKVFASPDALQQLNQIMHPRIHRIIQEKGRHYAECGHTVCLVDAAIIGDDQVLEPWLNGLILVLTPHDQRVERLMRTRGMTKEHVMERIAAQTLPEKKIPLADWIIQNDGSIDDLYSQVDSIAKELHDHAG